MTDERTPEGVITAALRESGRNYASTADRIMRELKQSGFEVIDMLGDVEREVADLLGEREDDLAGLSPEARQYVENWKGERDG